VISEREARLVRRAQQGDPEAFAELYERYQPTIYTYIFYRVGDAEVAEDLTADVFVRLVEKIHTFQVQDRPLLSWLYAIARNLIIDRHRRLERAPSLPLEERLIAEDAESQPAQVAERTLTRECLAKAMRHLTEDQRQVILLKFVEDRSNAEVAAILAKTEGAVKALQHRALAALRRALNKEKCYEP